MKEIIPSTLKPTNIFAEQVLEMKDPIIGIMQGHSKGFLIKTKYQSEQYEARCLGGFERGNNWDVNHTQGGTLKEWFNFFDPPNHKIFLFDTPQELFKWLSE